ncbi:MAG: helix-turn-helix domain-containing protein [Thermaerobacter sp.]|nr:helix-turn-helix domain-containing protein [Thermaerobacter sp.]
MVREQKEPEILCASCGSQQVLELVADKWTVIIVYILAGMSGRPVRYNELQHLIGGISQKMLTHTLRRLEYNGFVERKVYPVVPPKVEYRLTFLGGTMVKALQAVGHWGQEHFHEVEQARREYEERVGPEAVSDLS